MRRGLRVLPVTLAAILAMAPGAEAKDGGKLQIEIESSRPEHVTGGDALVSVAVPKRVKPRSVQVRLNGRPVPPGTLAPRSGRPQRLAGVVDGMRKGRNVLSARARGGDDADFLSVWNGPASGPVFSGPHQTPFFCTTEKSGLGPAADASCSAPTRVEWRYRTTGGAFKVLADPASRPADLARTTTRDGRTVDYVVRIESGVINRGIYRWAVLAPGGDPLAGWNGRHLHSFGGGCGAGHQQGSSGIGTVLDNRQLSQGYSVTSSSLTVLGTACNDVLSAETVSMVKEHVVESLGRAPAWTIGEGGSGGSIQAQLLAQNYPGLLDGLLPSASFPDAAGPDYPDCRLLQNYFGTAAGSALSGDQRESITGMTDPNSCAALAVGADVVNATEGCDESVVPPSQIFHPQSNPRGIRCTVWDSMVNVYGRDPDTGYARRTLDNVGVQYGLAALREGDISPGEFLDLNERIGGYDDNGFFRPQRSVGDPEAIATAYRTGRVNQGTYGARMVPVIDARNYVDDEINVHQYVNTYRFRARLDRTQGHHDNHVMLRAAGNQNVNAMQDSTLSLMGQWLDAIAGDRRSGASREQKVLDNKPAAAVDACWIGGQRIEGQAAIGAANQCETTYAPHRLPVDRAGRPLSSFALKCQLRPIDLADYPALGPAQQARLRAIFPGGVCDWSKPGVGERRFTAADQWAEFGPRRSAQRREQRVRLQAARRGGKVRLTATVRPCPAASWEKVTFLRKGKKRWARFDSALASGPGCKAKGTLRTRKAVVVKAEVSGHPGFRPDSQRKRIRKG